jgi:hypothetical protein
MVAIANTLGRALVLPKLWSGDFVGNAHILDFHEVFDVTALRTNLAG